VTISVNLCRDDYLALGSDQGPDGDYYLVVASIPSLTIIQEPLSLATYKCLLK
jgi:hypothetical protein